MSSNAPSERRKLAIINSGLSVIVYPGYKEYRLPNANAKTGSSILPGVLLAVFLSLCWQNLSTNMSRSITAISTLLFIRSVFSQLLYESVVLLPSHGIQLETCWGIPNVCSFGARKRFIATECIQDVIIHEGLSGWNVLFYLAVVKSTSSNGTELEVAFENILPSHPVLLEVYTGIHEILFSCPKKLDFTDIRK